MRSTFLISLGVLTLLSLAMWRSQPPASQSGKQPLVWTSDDNPLRKDQVALFNRLNPDLDLQLDPVNIQIEKVIVQSIAGVGPDLLDCRDANQLQAFVQAGIAWDITDELLRRGIDVKAQTWPVMQPIAIFEDRVYGVPTNCAVNAVWVNRDLVESEGIALPKGPMTWEQLIPIAQKLTKRDASGQPIQFGFLFDWWNYDHFLLSFGAHRFTEDGTRCILDSPEAERAIQLMSDLIYKYKVAPSPVEEAGMASQGGFGSGTINFFGAKRGALALGGRWWLANLRTFKGLQLGAMESPYGTVRASSAAGRVTLINKNSPRREQALKFLEYMASPAYNNLINHQADGIAAFRKYCDTPEFLHDPAYPNEADNAVWRDATAFAGSLETSPFVNGALANKIIFDQMDLVRINAKSAKAALHDAAKEINAEIRKAVARKPELRERYLKVTGGRMP